MTSATLRRKTSLVPFVICTLVASLVMAAAPSARAQSPNAIPRVGICNVLRIFKEIQETKDLNSKWQSEEGSFKNQDLEKTTKIKDLGAARDALKVDAPGYEKAQNDFIQAQIEYQAWKQITMANVQRGQKLQIAQVFTKISAAVAEIAAKKGIDLVMAEQRQDLPDNLDQLNLQQVQQLVTGRNVLYANASVDITNDVIQILDEKYKAQAGK